MELFKNAMIGLVLLLFTSLAKADPVNINTAGTGALAAAIVGVGPSKAEAIVNYRTEYGPFKSIDDLLNVKGIGHRIITENKGQLIVE